MKELVVDLYAHIFIFLGSVMDWILEKRFKRLVDSFNESLSKRFESEVKVIRRKAERIRDLAAQSSRAELRATRLTVEGIERDVRVGLVASAREQAEMNYRMKRLESEMADMVRGREQLDQAWQQLALFAKRMLTDNATGWLRGTREAPIDSVAMLANSPFYDNDLPGKPRSAGSS